jgi:hypothetical protein
MSIQASRTLTGSKRAAAVINALISIVGLIVSIAPLPAGSAGSGSDNPPFAVLIVGVVLGVLGLVGSFGIWRGERWGTFLTIAVRGLDGASSLFGVFAGDLSLRLLAILSVVSAVVVIFLLLRRGTNSEARTA